MKKFAISTAIGFIISIGCCVTSIVMFGELGLFMDGASAFITIGGTIGVTIVSFPPIVLKKMGPVIKKAFSNEKFNPEKDIETIVALNDIVKKKGLLALETASALYEGNDYLRRGITLMLDGADEEDLRAALDTETYFMQQRHQKGISMFETIASVAPAFGLLGTYMGLIPMLQNLEDPTKLGPLMSIQLLTSLYGSFIANVIFAPIAKRLKTMSADEVMRRELLTEGLVGVLLRKNPRLIREQLNCYLRTKQSAKRVRAVRGKETNHEAA